MALHDPTDIDLALARFRKFCQFEPHTGCVLWTGGTTSGRGNNTLYGSFWFNGQRWFAHRWSAKFIHGQQIDGSQVDHKCPHIPFPNTLCVEHVWPLSLGDNRELQDIRRFEQRKLFVQLEVGLLTYDQIYGVPVDPAEIIPFETFPAPGWLGLPPPPQCEGRRSVRSRLEFGRRSVRPPGSAYGPHGGLRAVRGAHLPGSGHRLSGGLLRRPRGSRPL